MVVAVALTTVDTGPRGVHAMDNGLARTPPMGWSSWNAFGGAQSQEKMVTIGDAVVATG